MKLHIIFIIIFTLPIAIFSYGDEKVKYGSSQDVFSDEVSLLLKEKGFKVLLNYKKIRSVSDPSRVALFVNNNNNVETLLLVFLAEERKNIRVGYFVSGSVLTSPKDLESAKKSADKFKRILANDLLVP